MTRARIYKPVKNAMQSGRHKTHHWVLEYAPTCRKTPDPLMGWNSSRDTTAQLKLKFPTQKDAIAYAQKNDITFDILPSRERKIKPKSYFSTVLRKSWS